MSSILFFYTEITSESCAPPAEERHICPGRVTSCSVAANRFILCKRPSTPTRSPAFTSSLPGIRLKLELSKQLLSRAERRPSTDPHWQEVHAVKRKHCSTFSPGTRRCVSIIKTCCRGFHSLWIFYGQKTKSRGQWPFPLPIGNEAKISPIQTLPSCGDRVIWSLCSSERETDQKHENFDIRVITDRRHLWDTFKVYFDFVVWSTSNLLTWRRWGLWFILHPRHQGAIMGEPSKHTHTHTWRFCASPQTNSVRLKILKMWIQLTVSGRQCFQHVFPEQRTFYDRDTTVCSQQKRWGRWGKLFFRSSFLVLCD